MSLFFQTAYGQFFLAHNPRILHTVFMFSELNNKQQEAVEAGDGPLLIVAGAGSGKTRTLTTRLAHLISNKKIKPERILAITFTNKAADEMKSRVKALIKTQRLKLNREPFVGTFHSFGAYILRKECKKMGRDASFTIYDRSDSLRTVKVAIKNLNISDKPNSPAYFLKNISRIKSEVAGEKLVLGEQHGERIAAVYREYERSLEENNAFDFDDLIEKVVRLFRKDKSILERWQKRYDYILIDEYQDVNTAQYLMVKLLGAEHQNIGVVGDDQQSIYKFRFSDFHNFLNFEKDWPKARVILLEQNYRSSKTIIDASSALITNNVNQKPKTLWTDNPQGDPVAVFEHENEFIQADMVAESCKQILKDGKAVGVLFRTNAQSRALEHIFLDAGVDYTLFGALSFYERKEIKDMVAALRVALNPKDKMALKRLEQTLYKKRTKNLCDKLPALVKDLSPAQLLEWVIKEVNYLDFLKRTFPNVAERAENLSELVYFAQQFDDLAMFMEQIVLASPLDRRHKKRTASGVSMMTIHLAKGLEFDAVHVVGVNEGLLPHQQSLFSSDEVEEERRLMYVAMTRAKKNLFLHFYDAPSRFLSELPGDTIKFAGACPLDDEERWIEYD